MVLFIGIEGAGNGKKLRLEGRLDVEAVPEVVRASGPPDTLEAVDLSELYSADEAGIAALRRLASQGVELIGVRPLIEYRLQEDETEIPAQT